MTIAAAPASPSTAIPNRGAAPARYSAQGHAAAGYRAPPALTARQGSIRVAARRVSRPRFEQKSPSAGRWRPAFANVRRPKLRLQQATAAAQSTPVSEHKMQVLASRAEPIAEPGTRIHQRAIRPTDASYSERNWQVVAEYWHPVAYSEEVAADPVAAVLLDVKLVLYRLDGQITAAHDQCPHRGVKLSSGAIKNGRLTCPYHGLGFGKDGVCERVPAHESPNRVHRYLNLETFPTVEHLGLIWVCLNAKPEHSLPQWSDIFGPGRLVATLSSDWSASAGRHVENFCDSAHFAFAHVGTFGVEEEPTVSPPRIERTAHGFNIAADLPMKMSADNSSEMVKTEYEIFLPYSVRMKMQSSSGVFDICDFASPITLTHIRIFQIISRDFDTDGDATLLIEAQRSVNEEDRVVVESQNPISLPLLPQAERHIGSDHFSIEYRKWWMEFQLTDPV